MIRPDERLRAECEKYDDTIRKLMGQRQKMKEEMDEILEFKQAKAEYEREIEEVRNGLCIIDHYIQ